MKQIIKILILSIGAITVSVSLPVKASTTESPVKTSPNTAKDDIPSVKSFYRALSILRYNPSEKSRQEAFSLFHESATDGYAQAMNALGIMYLRGWGCAIDTTASVLWFERAGENGYFKSYANLQRMYAHAVGLEQNYEKAFSYAGLLAADTNRVAKALGNYLTGYMLYKGLGNEQNYAKALMHFRIAANLDRTEANYFIGMAYRNGYGVERNEGEAGYFLQKGKKLGSKVAAKEIGRIEPENPITPILLNGDSENLKLRLPNQTVLKVKNHRIQNEIEGSYSGKLLTYDYSGKYLINSVPLSLKLERQGENITGQWIESDTLIADIQATLTDSLLIFHDMKYKRRNSKIEWVFRNANLELIQESELISLSGPVRFQMVKYLEPGYPMFLTLQRDSNQKEEQSVSSLTVYPNPFETQIDLSFEIAQAGQVALTVYTAQGIPVWSRSLGKLPEGDHHYQIPLDIPPGIYIINVINPGGVVKGVIRRK